MKTTETFILTTETKADKMTKKQGFFGNQNAKKEHADKAESFLHVRCKKSDKTRWVEASQRNNLRLSAWIIETLNEKIRLKKSG